MITRCFSSRSAADSPSFYQLYDIYDLLNINLFAEICASLSTYATDIGLSRFYYYKNYQKFIVLAYQYFSDLGQWYNFCDINTGDYSFSKSVDIKSSYFHWIADRHNFQSLPEGVNDKNQFIMLDAARDYYYAYDLVLYTYDWLEKDIIRQVILPADCLYDDFNFTENGKDFSLYLEKVGYYEINFNNQVPAQPTLDDSLQFNERKTQFGLPVLVSGDDKYWFQPQELKLLRTDLNDPFYCEGAEQILQDGAPRLGGFVSQDQEVFAIRDNALWLWETETGKTVNTLQSESHITTVAMMDQPSSLFIGDASGTLQVWNW